MRRFSVGRSPVGLLFSSLLLVTLAFGGAADPGLPANNAAAVPISPAVSETPLRVQPKLEFHYTGSFLVDGKFEPPSRLPDSQAQDNRLIRENNGHPAEVPSHINLHSREQTVESLLPRYRARKSARGQSFWTAVRDDIVTFAYGHERVLSAPQRVVTDSTGRVIVVDPAGSAIHVLSPEHSFRILTGPTRRVQTPAGVAVDGDDNIYIADSARGVVVVFDSKGRFLRHIGKLGDESLFHYPTGIAIDRRAGRLYVLDTERHLMFIMDLQGHELKRVGRYNSNDTVVDFLYPTEVAVGQGQLAVLDSDGQRVWITDLDGNPIGGFLLAQRPVSAMTDHVGLAIDAFANVYVSQSDSGRLSIYNRDGKLLNTLGATDDPAATLRLPTGVWIDARNRIFVSDQNNRRIEVFQLTTQGPEQVAGVH